MISFPERPFAKDLHIEERVWEDTGARFWLVYLDRACDCFPRELAHCATYDEARRFADSWSPDRDLFGNLLPLPEEELIF